MGQAGQGQRDRARLFDGEAERYDRIRPGYPEALIDDVLGPSPHGLSVLDVACGTGIAARQIAGRPRREESRCPGTEIAEQVAELCPFDGVEERGAHIAAV